jgi:hypothetical protein
VRGTERTEGRRASSWTWRTEKETNHKREGAFVQRLLLLGTGKKGGGTSRTATTPCLNSVVVKTEETSRSAGEERTDRGGLGLLVSRRIQVYCMRILDGWLTSARIVPFAGRLAASNYSQGLLWPRTFFIQDCESRVTSVVLRLARRCTAASEPCSESLPESSSDMF